MGRDHGLAGFPVIEKDVGCDFRRLYTIANGNRHYYSQTKGGREHGSGEDRENTH